MFSLRTATLRLSHSVPRPAIRQIHANATSRSKSTNGLIWASGALAALTVGTIVVVKVGERGGSAKVLRDGKRSALEPVSVPSPATTIPTPADLASPSSEPSSFAPLTTDTPSEAPPAESTELAQGEHAGGQSAAYDPVTGEINWDCPCLGGMADGPCGEQFKAAFACFVYSEAEPKGVDCVDKFRSMQECFRKHPEIYGADDIEEEDEAELIEMAEAILATPDEDFLPTKSS